MKLMLRKVQYAPEGEGMAPSVETTRDFVMSDKPLHVKASLDKEVGVSRFSSEHEVPTSMLESERWLFPDLLPRRGHQSSRQRHQQLQQKRQEHHRLW